MGELNSEPMLDAEVEMALVKSYGEQLLYSKSSSGVNEQRVSWI